MKHEYKNNAIMYYATGLMNIKDKRDYVKYLVVRSGIANATDSKALIRFDTDLKDGVYECIKRTKTTVHLLWVSDITDDMYSPDYNSILKTDDAISITLQSNLSYYNTTTGPSGLFWEMAEKASGNPINFKYLVDIPKVFDGKDTILYKRQGSETNNGPYVFKSDNVSIAIMVVSRS